MNPHNTRLPRVFIFGSCVSRDSIERLPRDSLEVALYVARQSFISINHDASLHLPQELQLEHAFQERMVTSDWRGDLWDRVDAAGQVDLVLIDLVDERHGVFWFMDGGVATKSIDALSSKALMSQLPEDQWVPFGSSLHLEAWKDAVEDFDTQLRSRGLREKVVVIDVPWADRDRDGNSVPSSMGTTASEANKKYVPYYRHLRKIGFHTVKVDGPVLGDSQHQWGLAPFHYAPEVYERINAGILSRLREIRDT